MAEITSGIIAATCRWGGASLSTPRRKSFTSSWADGLPPLNPAARCAAETALEGIEAAGLDPREKRMSSHNYAEAPIETERESGGEEPES